VTLTSAERDRLQRVIPARQSSQRQRTHARILLLADATQPDGAAPDAVISQKARTSLATVGRVRRRFAAAGLEAALSHKPQVNRKDPALDGAAEAHLVALVCGAPPDGQQRWTLHLLKETLIEGGYTDAVSHETVRQRLKKMNLSLG
jgi:homeodomain-containing protein